MTQKLRLRRLGDVDGIGEDMAGKTCIITGPTSGIGVETASAIVRRGARVILACRNIEKGKALADSIVRSSIERGATVIEPEVMKLDVSSLDSVREFAKLWESSGDRIDVLINNAGIFNMGVPRSCTKDGYEAHLGTNYMGHVLLVVLMMPYLKMAGKKSEARVIFVSSKLHKVGKLHFDDFQLKKEYSPLVAYSQSKLAQLLAVRHLRTTLQGLTGVKFYSLHPGEVLTEVVKTLPKMVQTLYRIVMQLFLLTPREGCRSTVFAASANIRDLEPKFETTGGYIGSDCLPLRPSSAAASDEDAERLWAWTMKELGIHVPS